MSFFQTLKYIKLNFKASEKLKRGCVRQYLFAVMCESVLEQSKQELHIHLVGYVDFRIREQNK